tara:strand:- start:116 stop:241 length:126 start_codon:yes stop_codon:yes gene_type:complete
VNFLPPFIDQVSPNLAREMFHLIKFPEPGHLLLDKLQKELF